MNYLLKKDSLTNYLKENPFINNIYIRGTNIDFEENFLTWSDSQRSITIYVDTEEIVQKIRSALTMTSNIHIESAENISMEIESLKEKIQSMEDQIESFSNLKNITMEIDSLKNGIEMLKDAMGGMNLGNLYKQIESLKNQVNSLTSTLSKNHLQGIVTIDKDSEGKIGLYIPGLLQIDNQEQNGLKGTNGNLVLEHETGDLLRRTIDTSPEIQPLEIFSLVENHDEYGGEWFLFPSEGNSSTTLRSLPHDIGIYPLGADSVVKQDNRIYQIKILDFGSNHQGIIFNDFPKTLRKIGASCFNGWIRNRDTPYHIRSSRIEIGENAFKDVKDLYLDALECEEMLISRNAFKNAQGMIRITRNCFDFIHRRGVQDGSLLQLMKVREGDQKHYVSIDDVEERFPEEEMRDKDYWVQLFVFEIVE